MVIATVILAGLLYVSRPESCDGLPRSIGACDPDRPQFEGQTCVDVSREWGSELDQQALEVLRGPEIAGGQARSSRLYDAETLVSQLANSHMRELGLTSQCEVASFLATGESQFSGEVREGVGSIMYDGDPMVGYEEWRSRLEGWISLILSVEESAPAP